MKTLRFLLVFAGVLVAADISSGQTITEFFIAYRSDHYQTQDGSTASGDLFNQANTKAFGFFTKVQGTGLSGTYSFTPNGGSTTNISIIVSDGLTYDGGVTAYATTTALFTAFPENDYSMVLPNTNPAGADSAPDAVSTFNLSGGVFPNVPQITGGTWSGGRLLIDPTQNYTINFTSFGTFGANDSIRLSVQGGASNGHDAEETVNVTSFFIPANSIVLAQGFTTIAKISFINGIDTDSSITGANGFTGYFSILTFEIQAIPEPSTYAAIFGGLALVGVMLHRRRKLQQG